MSQIVLFLLTLLYGGGFGTLWGFVSKWVRVAPVLTRVVVDFFLVGVLIVCAGVGMQVLNHKVDFYLLAGVALGFVLVVCLFFLPKISAVLPKDSQETVDASPKQET